MISARSRLIGHLRDFVEQQLFLLLRWDACKLAQPEPNLPQPNGRRHPEGKFKEIVTITFGDYELTVHSPNDDPPLGWIILQDGSGTIEGPLDRTTWLQMGAHIRKRGMRQHHGTEQSAVAAAADEWQPAR